MQLSTPRLLVLLGLTFGALLVLPQTGKAAMIQGPYCLYYSDGGVDCSQPSLEMCRFTTVYRPSIGRCYPNEKYHAAREYDREPARAKKRRSY
jgi:hypothetical protein